jgi:hypothetical protein
MGSREQEKMLKWQRKNPHRRMPIQTTSAVTSAAVQAIPAEGREQPTSWTMLPMLEDFGVRRPLDGPGRPANLGGPKDGPQWPMMSRTMTHVSGRV